MEEDLRDSGLDRTPVRPPRRTDGPLTGTYRTALDQIVRGGLSISRADVAHLMLATVHHTVGVATETQPRGAHPRAGPSFVAMSVRICT
ncbi:hypothetical protein GCM10022223_67400 [Kineosporia mesophila]|uniref:NAD(P)-binding domain-containing protein n=1 Tax=Kineosporia mesophila TaxID=566012 RepID=A0ABP7ARI9_9ACTN